MPGGESHTTQAYSKIGRIKVKYIFSKLDLSNLNFKARNMSKRLDALLIIDDK